SDSDDALGDFDVLQLQRRLARREVSAEELYAAARARVASADATLNAVVSMVDQPIPTQGPFAGIPSVLKDNEELTGYPTLQGSRAMPQTPATEDSVLVEMLRSLGLGFVAKTTMPE
ncbi:amidase family protein, partial [Arthrospira platensis SPKY1]|nr:amidase family protein [Arthrospira platensis SPKY1]